MNRTREQRRAAKKARDLGLPYLEALRLVTGLPMVMPTAEELERELPGIEPIEEPSIAAETRPYGVYTSPDNGEMNDVARIWLNDEEPTPSDYDGEPLTDEVPGEMFWERMITPLVIYQANNSPRA